MMASALFCFVVAYWKLCGSSTGLLTLFTAMIGTQVSYPTGCILSTTAIPSILILLLSMPFDINSLDKRDENKRTLQEQAHLPVRYDVPLLAMASRLTNQKGFDILAQIIHPLLAQGVQFVVLGIGDQHYQEMFQNLALR